MRSDAIGIDGHLTTNTGLIAVLWSSRANSGVGFQNSFTLYFYATGVLPSNGYGTARWWTFPLRCLVR